MRGTVSSIQLEGMDIELVLHGLSHEETQGN